MIILAHFGALLLLSVPSAAAAAGCTYNGRSYPNLATVTHDNGCAILQCQFGTMATYYEACGKEIDGSCHRVNVMFVHEGRTYKCKKVPTGAGYNYQYDSAFPKIENCDHNGKIYQHLDKSPCVLCGECQCQSGIEYILDQVCGDEIDGICHNVGEIFVSNTIAYECTVQELDEFNIYKNKVLNSAVGSRSCSVAGVTYKNLQVFKLPGSCTLRQCQDKTIKILAQGCSFKQNNGKCYKIGEEWSFNNKTNECIYDAEKGVARIEVTSTGYRKCKRAEKWYEHLQTHTRVDGCTSVQCQDGKTLPVEEGCLWNVDNKCYKLNFSWKQDSTFLKCVLTGDGLYRIITVDKNGKPIDRVTPTTAKPDFGDVCPTIAADIIFVWDSSGSISRDNYARQLNFSCEVVKAFKVGPDNVQVGGVIFSNNAEVVFDLNTYSNIDSICQAIKKTPFLGDTTETQKAFNLIVDDGMFSPPSGGRPNIMDIVIVITDGNSTDTTTTLAAANRLKALGAQVICIGVGRIKHEELYGIASRPENVFNTSGYEAIFKLKKEISTRTCNVPIEPPVDPEEPEPVACPKTAADIIFLLDSSSDIGSEIYRLKLDLAVNLTAQLTISPKSVQIGAVVFSSQATKVFDLNTYGSRGAVSKALAKAPYLQGSRETDNALSLVLNDGLFTADHGGRVDVARVLVVMIDGPSNDLSQSLTVSKALRNSGVRVVTVATGDYNFREVVGLSGDRNNVFLAPVFPLLTFVKAELYSRTCEVTKQPPPPGPEPPRCTDTVIPPCDHNCENTDTGYTCSCKRGYEVNQQNKSKCDDIDECKQKTSCQQLCVNTAGSYTCACKPGYVVNATDPTKCEDIDECSTSAPCEHTCTNTYGSYTCACNPGFVVSSSDPNKCKDIDECSQNSPCQQLCSNTLGSYTCSCKPGYVISVIDPTKCDDIDECSTSSPCQHICINTDGNYTCTCKPGYVVSASDPDKCDDIDECHTSSPCQHICINTDGNYTCACNPGYVVSASDPDKCEDIDECSTSSPCQHICINTDGNYTCACNPGYVVSPSDPNMCEDVNECLDVVNPPCHHICSNTDGSYKCSCKNGYTPNPCDTDICKDIDECEQTSCEHECINTRGSYKCSCPPGQVVDTSDATKCTDLI